MAEKKSIVTEFKDFALRGNAIELAVAVVIGAAFGAVVSALVKDLLTPLIAAVFGKPDFSELTFTIHKSQFFYGDFINAVVAFLSVAVAIFFFVVKPMNFFLERRKRDIAEGTEPEPPELSDEALLLTEIRDLLSADRS